MLFCSITLQILLVAFDVQPLSKHEAAKRLQPTGHLTQKSLHTGLCSSRRLYSRSSHETSRLRHHHLSACLKLNSVYCTVSQAQAYTAIDRCLGRCRVRAVCIRCSWHVCAKVKGHILSSSINIKRRCDARRCLLRFPLSTVQTHTYTHTLHTALDTGSQPSL